MSSSPLASNLFPLPFAEAPAINGERHQAFFRADRRVCRLHACATQQLFFPQVVLAGVPMHKEQPGRPLLPAVRNQQHRWNGFDPIQVKNQPLECVPIMFLGAHQARRRGLVVPGQITQQAPEFPSTALLINVELGSGSRAKQTDECPPALVKSLPQQPKPPTRSETHAGLHETLIFPYLLRGLIFKFVDIRVNAGGNGSLPEISSTGDQTLFSSEREFQIPRKVEASPFNRGCCIHSENAIMEGWQYLSVHPGAKKLPLYRITAFHQEDSYLDFQNRDG